MNVTLPLYHFNNDKINVNLEYLNANYLLVSAKFADKSIAAAAAGEASATICLVAPPVLNDEFLSGTEVRLLLKLYVIFKPSL